LGVLLTMRIPLRYRKGLFSIGLIVLLLILWQFLWYRWATLWYLSVNRC
jgi:cell division septal protein FtsQ